MSIRRCLASSSRSTLPSVVAPTGRWRFVGPEARRRDPGTGSCGPARRPGPRRTVRTGGRAPARARSVAHQRQGGGVEAPVHGLGDRRPGGRAAVPELVGQARPEALDRVPEHEQQPGLGGGPGEQRRHPREVEIVGGPLPGQGAREAGGTSRGRRRCRRARSRAVPKRDRKWRSLWISGRADTPGWAASNSYHQVVPAFWTPMPTKSGGSDRLAGGRAGGVKSKPSSQGAKRPRRCSRPRRTRGGRRRTAAATTERRLIDAG